MKNVLTYSNRNNGKDNKSYASLQDRLFLLLIMLVMTAIELKEPITEKTFLPRVHITSCSLLLNGRNVFDESINNPVKKYDEIRKVSVGQVDDYTSDCLLNYAYFKNN